MHSVMLLTEVFASGGIQHVNRHVCLALSRWAKREGHCVRFLSLMDEPGHVDRRYLEGNASFRGFAGNKAAFLLAALNQIRQPLDVVFATHVNLAPLALILKVFRPSLNFGIHLHGIEAWERLPILKRISLRKATFITSSSTYTKDMAARVHGLNPNRMYVLSPALDPFWMSASEETPVKQGLNLPEGKVLLTVARLDASEKYKGVDCVIRAMPTVLEQVPDAYYVVVGSGTDLQRLRSLAEEKGVQKSVRFVGHVSEGALRAYFDRCDLFVLPSKGEGFGIVFLEAMFYKKPVIAGYHGGSCEVVEAERTGLLVKHGDIEGLTRAIIGLLSDDERRLEMGKAGYERLMSHYTYSHFREKLVKVIQESL